VFLALAVGNLACGKYLLHKPRPEAVQALLQPLDLD
jgi:hypothetical protein